MAEPSRCTLHARRQKRVSVLADKIDGSLAHYHKTEPERPPCRRIIYRGTPFLSHRWSRTTDETAKLTMSIFKTTRGRPTGLALHLFRKNSDNLTSVFPDKVTNFKICGMYTRCISASVNIVLGKTLFGLCKPDTVFLICVFPMGR